MKSVSFDRAAGIYDETRGFPPGVADEVAQAALDLLPAGARALEIGIGTGRIAKPLLARGVRIFGADLSLNMMGRLLETLPPGHPAPRLVLADATELPFAARSFGAVISVHVFHLIAGWRSALDEIRRVLAPGGVLLTGYDWRPPGSPGERLRDKWQELVLASGVRNRPGATDFSDVDAALRATGAAADERSAGAWTRTRTLAQHLESIEHRTWSSSWDVPDDFFPALLAELRDWAAAELGPLDAEFTIPHKFVWQRYSWPA